MASKDEILQAIASQIARIDSHSHIIRQDIEQMTVRNESGNTAVLEQLERYGNQTQAEHANLERLLNGLNQAQQQEAMKQRGTAILDSLHFPEMEQRWSSIDNPYPETFGWIFEDPDSIFRAWLSSNEGLFWIRGEAGSGKSTLMKYLHSHSQTQRHLKHWAGNNPFIVAEHYFWYPGSDMQKSSQGLLQTLLYKVLEADKNLIPHVCEERWMTDSRHLNHHWSHEQLLKAFERIGANMSTKFCFFIDGLDEYHPHSQHRPLVSVVKTLASCPNIKVCVSSRPGQPFNEAWERLNTKIKLEDLTSADIQEFTIKTLKAVSSDASCCSDADLRDLSEGVRSKAEGVFLWVSLATGALCERLAVGQEIEQLRLCLDEFPVDLEAYFKSRIYERIHSTWVVDTALVLKLAVLCALNTPLMPVEFGLVAGNIPCTSYITFWLLCRSIKTRKGMLDPRFAFQDSNEMVDIMNHEQAYAETRNFLDACCKDFLQISALRSDISDDDDDDDDDFRWIQVTFLHRTAFDFLNTEDMQNLLNKHVPQHFKERHFIPHLALYLLKSMPYGTFESQLTTTRVVFIYDGQLAFGEEQELVNECDLAHFHRWCECRNFALLLQPRPDNHFCLATLLTYFAARHERQN